MIGARLFLVVATGAAIFAAGVPPAARAQTRDLGAQGRFEPAGTSSISGMILTEDEPPKPLRRAIVTISEASSVIQPRVVTSDETGHFVFRSLPAGRYTVSAKRPPYVAGAYGARRVSGPAGIVSGTVIVVGIGQNVPDINVVLPRGAVITGTLRDADGQPARNFRVTALYKARAPATGEQVLTTFTTAGTDDRGVYRLYGLRPGSYFLSASGGTSDGSRMTDLEIARATDLLQRPGVASAAATAATTTAPVAPPPRRPTVGYVPVFFPGLTDATQALPVVVGVGEERTAVDFHMQLVPTAQLEVRASFSDPTFKGRAQVRVTQRGPAMASAPMGFTNYSIGDQAPLTIPGLAPGAYAVEARTFAVAGVSGLSATADVVISGTDQSVSLTFQPAVSFSGRVIFEGTSIKPPADLTRVRAQLTPVRMSSLMESVPANLAATGEFTIANVPAGRYSLSAVLPVPSHESGWYVKSVMAGGVETLDSLIDIRAGADMSGAVITMTDRPTEIAGTMTDSIGAAAPEYFIIAFSADQSHWTPSSRRIMQTRPSSDGSFSFRNLPPGEYRLAAVTEVQQGEWFDPEFLSQLVDASIRLALTEGGLLRQDLRVK